MNNLETFKEFLAQNEIQQMFMTGQAGTGKTYNLSELVEYCHKMNISFAVTAYTHKALGVLRERIGDNANFFTLDSLLNRFPTQNDEALKVAHVSSSFKSPGFKMIPSVLFVDEFSNVNAHCYELIKNNMLKVVFIGDMNQLLPINDICRVKPFGKFWIKLNKVHRQAEGNGILKVTSVLNRCIQFGEKFHGISANENVIKVEKAPKDCKILAYKNASVQSWNSFIQGRSHPIEDDKLFCASDSSEYDFIQRLDIDKCEDITISGPMSVIDKGILNRVFSSGITEIFRLRHSSGIEMNKLVIFGHQNYNDYINGLRKYAVGKNQNIKRITKCDSINNYAVVNYKEEIVIDRNRAWRDLKEAKDNIYCFDFNHSITTHKSQGSTYDNVYVDVSDLASCKRRNPELYLRLLYVALSRAKFNAYY